MEEMMIKTLRENAKAEAIQDIPGIANSLNWAADEIERLSSLAEAEQIATNLNAQEIKRLRDVISSLADVVTGEGICAKPWTGVRCDGCECGDKNYE